MSHNGFTIRPAAPADGDALKALMLAYIVDLFGAVRSLTAASWTR
jgi:hypothetical protein